ncbi:C99L2 protein, partial [Asarcornis scutulata]|nr:C99L2 protein [Asarcornis scutulata]
SQTCADSLSAGYGDDTGGFNLEDALGPVPQFDLADYFDDPLETTTRPAKPTPKPFPRPGKPDNSFGDVIRTTTTKRPKTTRPPPRHNPGEHELPATLLPAFALCIHRRGRKKPQSFVVIFKAFSDDDLAGIVDGGYSPDKKKGKHGPAGGSTVETGTIAGIASALAMALVGAVSSYISYQQKKFCFSIQR